MRTKRQRVYRKSWFVTSRARGDTHCFSSRGSSYSSAYPSSSPFTHNEKQALGWPVRIALNALTICGIMRTNSAVVLLTSTTTVPIYGKLADLYGRKPIFLFGTAIFLLGSIFSGAAQSMEELIIFRAIQGLGAGAVLPIVLTIIGDIFGL